MTQTPWTRAANGTEHGEQSALFMWANMAARFGTTAASDPLSYTEKGGAKAYLDLIEGGTARDTRLPVLLRLYAIKNQGHGDAIRGNLSKAEGVKAGVPDLFLPAPKPLPELDYVTFRPFIDNILTPVVCGLYIELKRRASKPTKATGETVKRAKGRTSEVQDEWIPFLRSQGYVVAVCYGWEEARDILLAYLRGTKPTA